MSSLIIKFVNFCILLVCTECNRPNIILIIADDMGWNDVGFHGSNEIPTPNIDALGYNGIILNRFYTEPTCTPSRAALLTGKYPMRYGFQGFPIKSGDPRYLPLNIPLLPERLKELGYKNHLIGKWHLGSAYKKVTPTKRGFDEHFGYWNGFVSYFDYENIQNTTEANTTITMKGLDLHDAFEPVRDKTGQYATDLFTQKAIQVIWNHKKTEPLFLMLSHLAPHTGKNGKLLEVPNPEEADRKFHYIKDPWRRLYAEIVSRLDTSIGEVIEALVETQMLNNSIVLFMSDNGAQTVGIHNNYGSNWPLRGLKFTLYEGGVRGTAVIFSTLFKTHGYVSESLMHITDLLPTLYTAAGGNASDLGLLDGLNQWEMLQNNLKSSKSSVLLNLDELHNVSALIGHNGRYKLVNGTIKYSPILESVWDGYFGDSGREPNNPTYDTGLVLNSPTNLAIGKLHNWSKLTEEKIIQMRSRAEVNCNPTQDTTDCTKFCLFDLKEDPCETHNLFEQLEEVSHNLQNELGIYWKQYVGQHRYIVDSRANPIYFNNTWHTWLEDSVDIECRVS